MQHPSELSMHHWKSALLGVLVLAVACDRHDAAPVAQNETPTDSVSLVARAREVHLRVRTGDSAKVLVVLGFRRDSLGAIVVLAPECPPSFGCAGGGTRVRVWTGDSATLI